MWPLVAWQNRLLAASVVAGGVWLHGWYVGLSGERDRWQARTAALAAQRNIAAARAAGQAEVIARAAAERAELLIELEEAANADADANRPAFSPDAVQRLRAIR